MRIAIINPVFSYKGGTERYSVDIASSLSYAGHDVHVFANEIDLVADGIIFHKIPKLHLGKIGDLFFFDSFTKYAVKKEEKKQRFDIILSLSRTTYQDIIRLGGGCHKSYLNIMKSSNNNNSFLKAIKPLSNHLFTNSFLLKKEQEYIKNTKNIIAVSHHVKNDIKKFYGVNGDSISVLHNGINLSRFNINQKKYKKEDLRRELNIEKNAKVILFIGNGLYRKGFDLAVEAIYSFCRDLKKQSDKFHFLIVSKDAEKNLKLKTEVTSLLHSVSCDVSFYKTTSDIIPFYVLSDVLLLPTRYDPFANVCLEAFSMGKVVITSNLSGFSEILPENFKEFIVHAPIQVNDLIKAISSWYNHKNILSLEKEAVEIAKEYNLANHTKSLLQVINKSIDNESGKNL